MIGENACLAQLGGLEPARNQTPVRANDSLCDHNLISHTRGYSSVSELSSSDDAGNHWVGVASNGEECSTPVEAKRLAVVANSAERCQASLQAPLPLLAPMLLPMGWEVRLPARQCLPVPEQQPCSNGAQDRK